MNSSALDQNKPSSTKPFIIAWALALLFYFFQYVIRSAPAVMIPELSAAFSLPATGVSSIVGNYYYTYSFISLIAGVALDRFGAKYPVTVGTAIIGLGCLLFAVASSFSGNTGRLLQGMGAAFAFPGCVYLATRGFSARYLATAIGITQCIGMLGGSMGQSGVGQMLRNGISVHSFWVALGIICLVIACVLLWITPKEEKTSKSSNHSVGQLFSPYKIVFGNGQSYLCGLVSGLLFTPTTVFVMVWGVAFLQTDRAFSFTDAAFTSSMVPMGWVLGCPLLGWLADKIGQRKPVVLGGGFLMLLSIAQLIFAPALLPTSVTMFLLGVGSGAAMIPYSIIKEVNPDHVKGSATGAINFLTFGVTSIVGPLFTHLYGATLTTHQDHAAHFQAAGIFWMGCITLAMIISLFLKETGFKKTT